MKGCGNNLKNKRLAISGAILVIVVIIAVIVFTVLAKNNGSAEKKVVNNFTEALQKQKYDAIAPLVVSDKANDEKNSEDIVKRYKNVFDSLEVTETKITNVDVKKDEDDKKYHFSYKAKYKTFLGWTEEFKYKGSFVEDNEEVKIAWQPSLIIPFMSPGDKIAVDNTAAKRGEIVDVNGEKLAFNKQQKQAGLYPDQLKLGKGQKENLKSIAALFDVDEKILTAQLKQEWVQGDSFVPIKIVPLSFKVPDAINGVTMKEVRARYYPYSEAASHLIGYVGEVSAEDIKKEPTFKPGDLIGKSGLEYTFNKRLKGENGGSITVVNDVTDKADNVQMKKAVNGENIHLTINADIQAKAYEELKDTVGSYTAMDPKTGGLTALVSVPAYDPNKMTAGITDKDYAKYESDKNLPFLARYTARYAPGSTFKTITAGIGLDAKKIDPLKKRAITGLKWQKDKSWGDYFVTRVSDVPQVDMTDALVYSDNIYFAQEALSMGQDTMENGLKKLPFGTDFKLPLDMADAQLSNKGINSDILLADTSYGQGELLITPIQQLAMYSTFARDGKLIYPHLEVTKNAPKETEIFIKETAGKVKNALYETVNRPEGTAHGLQTAGKHIAAKTGTAEIKEKQDTKGDENSFVLAMDTTDASYISITMVEKSNVNLKGKKIVDVTKPILGFYYDNLK
ncbi:penicillin-binding protein PBP4(5) [Brochothrix thermosphacta]|uniref:penicillin-binding protein PBP4(5) n=1 Tax=Brochothrix thermosphacta TaxID=2756 RepID=UPI003F8E2507